MNFNWNYFLFLPKRGTDWVFCKVGNPWVPHVAKVPGGQPQDRQVGRGLHDAVLVQLQARRVGLRRRGPRGRRGHPRHHRVGPVVHLGRQQPRPPVLCPRGCRQRGRIWIQIRKFLWGQIRKKIGQFSNKITVIWEMVRNGPKWSEMDRNGLKWTEMVPNGPKWSQMDWYGPKWSQMDPNGRKWPNSGN